MIWQECPRKTPRLRGDDQVLQPVKEIASILVGAKDTPALDSPNDDVVKGAGCVYSRFSRHGRSVTEWR